jgi:catechol 2,3-dioxygenase-like lactoylglutathione lyase family enzyme
MSVRALGWLGVMTQHFAEMTTFYRDVLQLEELASDHQSARFRLKNGTETHVYACNDGFHEFFGSSPVVGFEVDEFWQVHHALSQAGIQFIYPEPQRANGQIWQHFRAPDGNVYEIIGSDKI